MISALIIFAVLLFALELVLPGGVLGAVATVCLLAASLVGFVQYGSQVGLTILVLGLAFAVIFFYLELRFLGTSKFTERLFGHRSAIEGDTGMTLPENLVGSEGIALTRMNPIGRVQVGDQALSAYSVDGMIPEGARIVVQKAHPFKIEVSQL